MPLSSLLTEALNAGVLTEEGKPASEMEELLKEALRCEAENRQRIGFKHPRCETCGTRRTPTFPCKKCWPEDWNERYRIARAMKQP